MKLQRYKRDSLVSYAMGATLVAELLKTYPEAITRVFLRPTEKHGNDLDSIIADIKQRNIEIIESAKTFNILGAKENCLLLAEFKKDPILKYTTEKMTIPRIPINHIVLVNPSDAGNLGTIMRSAIAFNFKKMTIVTPAVDPFDPKVIRASMGAIFHLDITEIDDYTTILTNENSFAFILDRNAQKLENIKTIAPANDTILFFGNEASGLPKNFANETGAKPIYIKQSDNVDSLNLSIAASIAMHHFETVKNDMDYLYR